MPEHIITVARWQTTEPFIDEVLELVAKLRLASVAESGCLGYEVFKLINDPTALLIFERYRDRDALESHRNSTHYRELVQQRILPLLSARRVELLREL